MATSKICMKCGGLKPLTEYYPLKRMKDGHLNKCKSCTKLDVAMRAADPAARIRMAAYERSRYQTPERKAKTIEYQRQYRLRNPEKYKARTAVRNALRDGRLQKKPCAVCGAPDTQAHHTDYKYPLAVRWLCFKHHRLVGHKQKSCSHN